ncbi:hypothetical protein FRC00_005030 [Tulasnella sp. 408]|nr:hypothetical protein FRC00_005030 [Tulasnella sp. 408]
MMPPPAKPNASADDMEDELIEELDEFDKTVMGRVRLARDYLAYTKLQPFYEERRAVVSKIPKFWPHVLENHGPMEMELQHRDDIVAMSYLTDLWIVRDAKEPRAFTAEFYFSENPYFSDSVLKKEFKYVPSPPEDAADVPSSEPGEDGISDAQLAFDWDTDIKPQAIKIKWKSDAKNLTKQHPRKNEDDDEEDVLDPGSFFNWFEHADDPKDLASTFEEDIFAHAIQYFLGKGPNQRGEDGSDEDDDDEDEDDEGSIDLEEPVKKKAKHSAT